MDLFCQIIAEEEKSEHGDIHMLWDKYLLDFFHYKLLVSTRLEKDGNEEYIMKMLEEYFRPLKQERNTLNRIIALHTHIKINHLHLARVLHTLQIVNSFISAEHEQSFISPMAQDSSDISCRSKDLAEYVINDMFKALQKAMQSQNFFELWYEAYFNMVSFYLAS